MTVVPLRVPAGDFNTHRRCRHGEMIFNRHDAYVGRSLELYREYSEGEVDLFRALLDPGAIVIDVGANVGAHTIPLAHLVAPGGQVYAFEPQLQMYLALCGNIALNCSGGVVPGLVALGATAGQSLLPHVDYGRPHNFGALELGSYADGETTEIVALDSFEFRRLDFAKIDVEGWERDVLVGGTETIRRLRPVLYVENDRLPKAADLVRYLTDTLGYGPLFWHTPPLYNPDNFAGNRENVFGRIVSLNLLCAPPDGPHRERVLAYAGRAMLRRV